MTATSSWKAGAGLTVLSTELNALANTQATALGAQQDNTPATLGYEVAWAHLSVTFGSAPTDQGYVDLYYVLDADGATDSTAVVGASPKLQPAHKLARFIIQGTALAQELDAGPFTLPPFKGKYVALNTAGVAFPASGSTIKLYPFTEQQA